MLYFFLNTFTKIKHFLNFFYPCFSRSHCLDTLQSASACMRSWRGRVMPCWQRKLQTVSPLLWSCQTDVRLWAKPGSPHRTSWLVISGLYLNSWSAPLITSSINDCHYMICFFKGKYINCLKQSDTLGALAYWFQHDIFPDIVLICRVIMMMEITSHSICEAAILHLMFQPGPGWQRCDISGEWGAVGPGQTPRAGLLSWDLAFWQWGCSGCEYIQL